MGRLQRLREDAARNGLAVRGVFAPRADDNVPPVSEAVPARTLVLVGNVGSSLWPAFSVSPEFADGREHPLDRWSRRIGEDMARAAGGLALFPFGRPPHHPFQRWALRTGVLFASPVGLLVDPTYGLWHAFRFAIALRDLIEEPMLPATSPCVDCTSKPCLTRCPVTAFRAGEYRHNVCVGHLAAHPGAECWRIGCLARHACPVGENHRYSPPHANFHMRAFLARQICSA